MANCECIKLLLSRFFWTLGVYYALRSISSVIQFEAHWSPSLNQPLGHRHTHTHWHTLNLIDCKHLNFLKRISLSFYDGVCSHFWAIGKLSAKISIRIQIWICICICICIYWWPARRTACKWQTSRVIFNCQSLLMISLRDPTADKLEL